MLRPMFAHVFASVILDGGFIDIPIAPTFHFGSRDLRIRVSKNKMNRFLSTCAREYDSIRRRFVLRKHLRTRERHPREEKLDASTNELSATDLVLPCDDDLFCSCAYTSGILLPSSCVCFVVIHLYLSRICQRSFPATSTHARFPCLRKRAWGQGGMIMTIKFAVRHRQRWSHHHHHYRHHCCCCRRHRRCQRRRSLAITGDAPASRRCDVATSHGLRLSRLVVIRLAFCTTMRQSDEQNL